MFTKSYLYSRIYVPYFPHIHLHAHVATPLHIKHCSIVNRRHDNPLNDHCLAQN